jgi:histidinol-phosphate aminotransferase
VATDWSRLVRPSLLGVEPYRPGATLSELQREHGLDHVAKLNWNEDLFGPLPGALEAVEEELENVWMYPEQAYADLRDAVAGWIGTDAGHVVPSHGIQALVATVARAFVRDGDHVVVPSPTYGLYAQVCAAAGATVTHVRCRDLRLDLPALAEAARDTDARLVWVCDPNNPTGSLVEHEEWEAFIGELPAGTVAVVDEAYREYVEPARRITRERDVEAGRPVVLLRTFSKIFGLAGLRLGYGVCAPELAAYLDVIQEPFNVNRAALAAGRACLAHPDRIEERRRLSADARAHLGTLLTEAGFHVYASQANFVLVRLGVDDVEVCDRLVRRGLLVRPGSEFGLPGYVRITVGPRPLMERAASALGEEVAGLVPRGAVN